MPRRNLKYLLHYSLAIGLACCFVACDNAKIDNKKTILDEKISVENRRPTPEFSIPDKIKGKSYLSFIALGDQGRGGSSQKHVALLMNEKGEKDTLDFIITLGDNFYQRGVKSVTDPQWLEKFEAMYDLPSLHVPFYASLGNHDHKDGNAHHQVEYSKKNTRWTMPNYYYTFTKVIDTQSSIQFFALDTYVLNRQSEYDREHVEWLERELNASDATWKVVYGHHPIFSYGKHGNQKQMIDLVRPLLEKYGVDVYICGHDHDRQLLEPVGGVYYIVSGTGSKSRDTRYGASTIFAGSNLGFAWFRVSDNEFHMQFIDTNGDVEYAHTWFKGSVTKRPYKVLDNTNNFSKKKSNGFALVAMS